MRDKNHIWRMWNISIGWVPQQKMMQDICMKFNPGLPWQKQHSARRRIFPPANWTYI
jgi:hypothetical protein